MFALLMYLVNMWLEERKQTKAKIEIEAVAKERIRMLKEVQAIAAKHAAKPKGKFIAIMPARRAGFTLRAGLYRIENGAIFEVTRHFELRAVSDPTILQTIFHGDKEEVDELEIMDVRFTDLHNKVQRLKALRY